MKVKVLEMVNDEGVKRYYSEFYCEPYLCRGDICYFVRGQYYDCVRGFDVTDIVLCSDDMSEAMKMCVEYVTKLSEQPDAGIDDPLFITYFHQVERLEDDSNDNNGK